VESPEETGTAFTEGQVKELAVVFKSLAERITAQVTASVMAEIKPILEKAVQETEVENTRLKEVLHMTPSQGLQEAIFGVGNLFGKSVISSTSTLIDGRTQMAKDGPVETPAETGKGMQSIIGNILGGTALAGLQTIKQ
jgi:hypothetical protein